MRNHQTGKRWQPDIDLHLHPGAVALAVSEVLILFISVVELLVRDVFKPGGIL